MPYESIPRWRQSPNCLQIFSSWFLPTFDGGLTRQKCDLSKRANDQTQLEYNSFFPNAGNAVEWGQAGTFFNPLGFITFWRSAQVWNEYLPHGNPHHEHPDGPSLIRCVC